MKRGAIIFEFQSTSNCGIDLKNPSFVYMKFVKLMNRHGHREGKQAYTHTECEPEDIEQGKKLVFGEIPKGNEKVVFEHSN